MSAAQLSTEQVEEFRARGFLLLRSFLDVDSQVEPIRRQIYDIIGLLLERSGLATERAAYSPANFDAGYQALCAKDRSLGGMVYDAIKQIPAFMRYVTDARFERMVAQLRDTNTVGLAAGGYGMRIDNPGETRFQAPWHQEYPAQFRSLDGVIFWSPLQPVNEQLGPVRVRVGSHREGPLRVYNASATKASAYDLRLEREAEVIERYAEAAPTTKPGDVMLLDFLLVHSSGENRTDRARWSMQTRYFNFGEPTGRRIGWCGSFAAGKDIANVHPELLCDPPSAQSAKQL